MAANESANADGPQLMASKVFLNIAQKKATRQKANSITDTMTTVPIVMQEGGTGGGANGLGGYKGPGGRGVGGSCGGALG